MSSRTLTGTYLDRILENTERELAERKSTFPETELQSRAALMPEPISLAGSLRSTRVGLIAEIKRASPSKGTIAPDIEAGAVAREYLAGGCAALSVLTDATFFQGSLDDLSEVATVAHADVSPRPVLRKDFVIDGYQITEARAHGADAILLIVAALSDSNLRELYESASEFGMDALVEVHDEAELERALAISPRIIGINNRDLRTFNVDLGTTETLATKVPRDITLVGESGIYTHRDLERLGNAGVHAVLVSESLMRQEDRSKAVRELLG